MTGDKLIRFMATLAVLVVAVIAAAISYGHIVSVALSNGQTLLASRALPLSVDGAVVAASMVLLDAARRGVPAPALGRVMLGAGILATLAANAVSGAGHGPVGVVVAMLPAGAFIGSVELLLSMVRVRAQGTPEAVPDVANGSAPVTVPQPTQAVPQATAGAAFVSAPGTRSRAPKALPRSRTRARGIGAPEAVFAAEVEAGVVPSVRTVKRQMRVGQDRAVQIRQELSARLSAPPATIEA